MACISQRAALADTLSEGVATDDAFRRSFRIKTANVLEVRSFIKRRRWRKLMACPGL